MRPSPGSALLSLLCLSSVVACSHPQVAASTHGSLESSPPAPTLFVERPGPLPPNFVERGPACPAAVGVAPTPFFDERVVVRLPPGLEGAEIPERSSSFARSSGPLAMGCAPDLAASVFVIEQRQARDENLPRARRRLFDDLNFPGELDIDIVDGSDEGGDISLSISFPDHAVWGNTRVYLRMIERYGRVHAIGFLAERDSYHQLEPVFEASAATMLALPD